MRIVNRERPTRQNVVATLRLRIKKLERLVWDAIYALQASIARPRVFDVCSRSHEEAYPEPITSRMVCDAHFGACDHTFFSPQIDYFSQYHRVKAPDLLGHGASDAPLQKYTVMQFADDLAWLCRELQVEQAVLVGHSMGGVVALGR
jgi:pimeloyl-ACP methyl ester carboxylesterase